MEQSLDIKIIRRNGDVLHDGRTVADPDDTDRLQKILRRHVLGQRWDEGRLPEFSMEVRPSGGRGTLTRVSGG
jgi:hypothetical protein